MKDAKCVNTPVDAGSRLVKAIEGDELFDQVVYQSTIGSLLYLYWHQTRYCICSK